MCEISKGGVKRFKETLKLCKSQRLVKPLAMCSFQTFESGAPSEQNFELINCKGARFLGIRGHAIPEKFKFKVPFSGISRSVDAL